MKRTIIIVLSIGLCAATIIGVAARQNQFSTLRAEHAQVLARLADPAETASPVASANPPSVAVSRSTPVELLQLRAEVTRLGNRKRELAQVRAERERLSTQLATRGTNASGALPVGYLRKAQARFVGYGTPEDTLQSFIWAVQNRDVIRLLETMSPEAAKDFQKNFEDEQSKTRFFDDAGVMPGFQVVERKVEDENSVMLQVQIVPGQSDGSQEMKFERINGQWKLRY